MAECSKIPIAAVVGPTASGKTALAVGLALRYGGEVVSADSMQLYRGMDILTAKPTSAETRGVPHHLIGFLDAGSSFSVADYCRAAKRCIEDIASRGRRVILCGGTGLYVSALLDNLSFAGDGADPALREALRKRVTAEGAQTLLRELAAFDPETAASLHVNNVGRIIRAIELYMTAGVTMSEQKRLSKSSPPPYRVCVLCLDAENRRFLYDRIDRRVDKMLQDGLLAEARALYQSAPGGTARQAIGGKELTPYFAGEMTLDEAVEGLKRATRRYAKRQLTWFNRMDGVQKLYIDACGGADDVLAAASALVDGSKIFPGGAGVR